MASISFFSRANWSAVQVGQGRAHRAGAAADGGHARLDDGDGIALVLVADGDIGQHEFLQPLHHLGMVLGAHRVIEAQRPFRHEIVDGRGIGGDAHFQIGQGEGLRRRQAADIGQAVAHLGIDPHHQFDVADAVLEADQVGIAVAQFGQAVFGQHGIVAVVDDDADRGGFAHRFDMGHQAFLDGHHQIGRQQQQAVGAGLLGRLGQLHRDGGAIAAAGDHRGLALGFLHRGGDHGADFGRGQGEELAGAAGGEQAGQALEAQQPGAMFAIGAFLELEVLVEMGDGKGQQALGQGLRHFVWATCCS